MFRKDHQNKTEQKFNLHKTYTADSKIHTRMKKSVHGYDLSTSCTHNNTMDSPLIQMTLELGLFWEVGDVVKDVYMVWWVVLPIRTQCHCVSSYIFQGALQNSKGVDWMRWIIGCGGTLLGVILTVLAFKVRASISRCIKGTYRAVLISKSLYFLRVFLCLIIGIYVNKVL